MCVPGVFESHAEVITSHINWLIVWILCKYLFCKITAVYAGQGIQDEHLAITDLGLVSFYKVWNTNSESSLQVGNINFSDW